jgi:hypothetical protein
MRSDAKLSNPQRTRAAGSAAASDKVPTALTKK